MLSFKSIAFTVLSLTCAAATASAQDCSAVATWETSAQSLLSVKGRFAKDGPLSEMAPYYNTPEFLAMTGKPFEQMSYGERREVGLAIAKCSRNEYLRHTGTRALFDSAQGPHYLEMTRLLKKPAAATKPEPTMKIVHWAGDKIVETPDFKAYFRRYNTSLSAKTCGSSVQVSIVAQRDQNGDADFGYIPMASFIRGPLKSALRAVCKNAQTINGDVFVEDVFAAKVQGDIWKIKRIDADSIRNNQQNETPVAVLQASLFEPFGLSITPSARLVEPDGSFASLDQSYELLTLSGLSAAMDRNFKVQDPAIGLASKQALRQEQIALVGVEVPHEGIWTLLKGGDYSFGTATLLDRRKAMADEIEVFAQAYGLSVVQKCQTQVVGGTEVRTFQIGSAATGDVSAERKFTVVKDIGETATAYQPGDKLQPFFKWHNLFYEAARTGPIRESVDSVINANACLSPVHKKMHANVVELLKHHDLVD